MSTSSFLKQPKSVWAVAFACVIAFMGIGLVDPILKPIADQLGAGPSEVSLLFTSYMAVMGVAMLVTGFVSSRIGAKRTLLAGLALIVVSTTLDRADWENTRLIKDNVAEEVGKLKQQAGKDMIVMGSSGLAVSLAEMGLVDEFRIMVNPVVLGAGKPVFSGIQGMMNLKLLKARTFGNGNVLLYYAPGDKAV